MSLFVVCRRIADLRVTLLCLLIGVVTIPAWAQQTIDVPSDEPTIQAAINAASGGDTVLVAPGTYKENINFDGKAITVTSSAGPQTTIIDGSAGPITVQFVSGETRASVLNGFTIENAGASLWPNESNDVYFFGIKIAGVAGSLNATSYANPTITNNIIIHNYGYGIDVRFAGALISGNIISDTSTQYDPRFDFGCDYDDGDGIFVEGAPSNTSVFTVISDNTIENNVGHCEGGGIGLYAAPLSTVISNNIIANNQSLGYGGGVYEVNGSVSLYQNLIYNNVSGVAGGGVYLSTPSQINGATGPLDVFVINNTIYGNTISLNTKIQDAWVDGSQVALAGYVSQLGLFNNLIIADDSYSAFSCWPAYQYLSGTPPVVLNSDVTNTGGAAFGGWCTSPAGNTGNISADPKFNDPSNGDFHLQAGSPAIDTGFNAAPTLPAKDFDGNPRIQNATGSGEPVVDMGVYEAAGAPESRSPSQTSFTAQPEKVFYGQPVNLSATAMDNSSSPISAGTISFMDDWSPLQQSPLNNAGVATFSTSNLGLGPHWLVASFSGNATYQPNVSTATEVLVNGFSTTTTLSFSANPIHSDQPESLTATVSLGTGNPAGTGIPTGSIAFYVSDLGPTSLLATVPVDANGVAVYTTSSLPAGTAYVQAVFEPTGGFLRSVSTNLPLQIYGPPTAAVGISASPGNINTLQPVDVTITVNGNAGNPAPTGSVTLSSGSYSSASVPLSGDSATIHVPAGSLSAGIDSLTAKYSGDSVYPPATGTSSLEVTLPFSISGTALSVAPGAISANESTITVTPSDGFTGDVALTATITSSPAGATDLPSLSFGATGNVGITTAASGVATLTVTTVAPVNCPQGAGGGPNIRWLLPGDFGLMCIFLFATRRRGYWRPRLAMLFLLAGFTVGVAACGGGAAGTSCVSPGTTPGSYVITVTGTSGTTTATGSVNLTVQ